MPPSLPYNSVEIPAMATASSTFAASTAAAATTVSDHGASDAASIASSSISRNPSCEWHEWEETLDNFDTVLGLFGIDTSMDLVDLGSLDQFLLTTADDVFEPFLGSNATLDSPIVATGDQAFLYEKEQDVAMLRAAGFDVQSNSNKDLQHLVEPQPLLKQKAFFRLPTATTTSTGSTVPCHRKRKTTDSSRLRDEADSIENQDLQMKKKKTKRQEEHTSMKLVSVKSEMKTYEQIEDLYRRRYDILHGILEAWNTGGIEDLEEIADNVYAEDVVLFSPDYAEGLHGVEAIMSHWSLLLDAFPDGMMEEYIIKREVGSTEKMKATWTFSGTQIFPIFGVEPRHKKVCISGESLFVFKGERIQQIVLAWNYGETLLKLMGVQPEETHNVMLGASAFTNVSQPEIK